MKTFLLETGSQNINGALASFFRGLIENGVIDALVVPQDVKSKTSVVMTLVKDLNSLENINPFAPMVMTNAARIVSRLTITDPGQKIGVVLRSCETRAMIELVKLNQVTLDNLVIIGIDCMGTFEPKDYRDLVTGDKWNLEQWLKDAANGNTSYEGKDIRNACSMCAHVKAEHSLISIGWAGLDPAKELVIEVDDQLSESIKGIKGIKESGEVAGREDTINKIRADRQAVRDKRFEEFKAKTGDLSSMVDVLAGCMLCYNCRQVCPICFCQECVVTSPVLKQEPEDYLRLAQRKGVIEMPTDTLLFHLTRINHMAVSCVACGQCETACPGNIPVTLLFATTGKKIQDIFDYTPGLNPDEALPQTTYKVDELEPR